MLFLLSFKTDLSCRKKSGGKTLVVISSNENVIQRLRHGSLKDKVILIATKFAYRFAYSLISVLSGTLIYDKNFFGEAITPNASFINNQILDSVLKIHKQRFFSLTNYQLRIEVLYA